MTKTLTNVDSHNFSNTGLPAMISLGALVNGSFVGILNLAHWDLFEIWFLVLGI